MSDSEQNPQTAADSFAVFRQLCLSILAQSNNCTESQEAFRAATSIPELVTAFHRFFAGVLHEVPEQVLDAFTRLYDEYSAEIRRAGMYFNECPEGPNGAVILVGNLSESLDVYGNARVYILGPGTVNLHDYARCVCVSPDAVVNLYGSSDAIMEDGTCNAYENSSLTSAGGCHVTHGSVTVHASGGTVVSHGHRYITAYNDAVIKSFTNKHITLYDRAKLYRNKQSL